MSAAYALGGLVLLGAVAVWFIRYADKQIRLQEQQQARKTYERERSHRGWE